MVAYSISPHETHCPGSIMSGFCLESPEPLCEDCTGKSCHGG